MSVLINMSMPENCRECRFGYDGKCFAEQPFHRFFVGDTHKCPLIELPPHGRLIDSDELHDKIIEYCSDGYAESADDVCEILDYVRDAPTILEAEDGE